MSFACSLSLVSEAGTLHGLKPLKPGDTGSHLAGAIAEKLDLGVVMGKRAKIVGSTLRSRSVPFKTELVASLQASQNPATVTICRLPKHALRSLQGLEVEDTAC